VSEDGGEGGDGRPGGEGEEERWPACQAAGGRDTLLPKLPMWM